MTLQPNIEDRNGAAHNLKGEVHDAGSQVVN
jgi:hypothetical protein